LECGIFRLFYKKRRAFLEKWSSEGLYIRLILMWPSRLNIPKK
jgi:hypothetical protein